MLDESATLIQQQHSGHGFQNVEFEIEGDQIIIVDDDRVEGDSKLQSVNRWIGIDRLGDLMSLLGTAGSSELIDDISDGEIGWLHFSAHYITIGNRPVNLRVIMMKTLAKAIFKYA